MANRKMLEQAEVNRVVASRLRRERERLTRVFEARLKRCMAAVHLTLYQEMCALKQEMAAEAKDTQLFGWADAPLERPDNSSAKAAHDPQKGGEEE